MAERAPIPRMTPAEVVIEVERLFVAHPTRPGFDDALHRRYLADCVRSGIEPHYVSERARQHLANMLARVEGPRQADSQRGNALGSTAEGATQEDRPRTRTDRHAGY